MLFSVIASHASAASGAFSSASATSVASATALPDMSVCMSSIERCGLRLMPPVSNRMPLPTSATSGARRDRRRERPRQRRWAMPACASGIAARHRQKSAGTQALAAAPANTSAASGGAGAPVRQQPPIGGAHRVCWAAAPSACAPDCRRARWPRCARCPAAAPRTARSSSAASGAPGVLRKLRQCEALGPGRASAAPRTTAPHRPPIASTMRPMRSGRRPPARAAACRRAQALEAAGVGFDVGQ